MEQRTVALPAQALAEDQLGYFRWGHIGVKILVTNDAGDWAFLTQVELDDLLAGRIIDGHARFEEFRDKGFLRDGLDLDAMADRVASRNRHVSRGPHLHVVTLTSRNGQEGSAATADTDMNQETAEQVANLALQSASPAITFELQGGEPLLNFDVLQHLLDHAATRNQRVEGKTLAFSLLTNCAAMTEEKAEWLIAHDVTITTSLDGPASLHDANRDWKGGSKHADVVRWIEYFNRRYAELGRDPRLWHVTALMTTTRHTIAAWREVIDEYVARGLPTIQLRPLEESAFTAELWAKIGYSADEYMSFYRQALDYILDLNRRGVELVERTAAVFATKILTSDDAGVVDLQSPNGAGTGQIVYNQDGRVFPCDEARILDRRGESIFELGHVRELTVTEVLRHPSVRAIASASLLDAQPMCADCWNKPFCGISPVRNFASEGDLFGQRPLSFECKEHMGISGRLFEILSDESDTAAAGILRRWATEPRIAGDERILREAP